MASLLTLSNEQKAQVRNAFTLIDSDSKDGKITSADLVNVHKTLALEVPSEVVLQTMLGGRDSLSFAQFSQAMAAELAQIDDKTTLSNALKVFVKDRDSHNLTIDVDELKEACCSVQLGEIGSGDHRLSRSAFDKLTQDFVKEQMDGKRIFNASAWLEVYVE